MQFAFRVHTHSHSLNSHADRDRDTQQQRTQYQAQKDEVIFTTTNIIQVSFQDTDTYYSTFTYWHRHITKRACSLAHPMKRAISVCLLLACSRDDKCPIHPPFRPFFFCRSFFSRGVSFQL